jgi:hypothetical protein
MTSPTPSPWEIKAGRWIVATRGPHEGEIIAAATYWMDTAPDEAAANIALCASAPDMRALLAWIVAHCEVPLADDPERLAEAVAILSKTNGVS